MGIMDVLDRLSGPEYDELEMPEAEQSVLPEVLQPEPEMTDVPELPEPEPKKEDRPFKIRAEVIMAIIAAFAAVMVGVILVLSRHLSQLNSKPGGFLCHRFYAN